MEKSRRGVDISVARVKVKDAVAARSPFEREKGSARDLADFIEQARFV